MTSAQPVSPTKSIKQKADAGLVEVGSLAGSSLVRIYSLVESKTDSGSQKHKVDIELESGTM